LSIVTGGDKIEGARFERKEDVIKKDCPTKRANVYTAQIEIPFIEMPTMASPYGYDEILELVFCDSLAVANVKGYINGVPVQIYEYVYPSNPNMKAFYVELVGKVKSGMTIEFRLEIEWNNDCQRKATKQKYTDGAQVIQ
jgi:hypothetical protein